MMRVNAVSLSMWVLLIAAICSGNAIESQAKTGAKSEITGHWAAPDCAMAQEALAFTRHFYLKSAPERLELGRYTLGGRGADHLILDLGSTPMAVTRQEDGVLRTATLAGTSTPAMAWDALTLTAPLDYTHCPTVPETIPRPLQHVLLHIDAIAGVCSKDMTQKCTRALFDAFDADKNGRLSQVELTLGMARAALLASLAQHHVLDAAGIETASAHARDIAAQVPALFDALDRNGDGALDRTETATAPETGDLSAFKTLAAQLAGFFPALAKL